MRWLTNFLFSKKRKELKYREDYEIFESQTHLFPELIARGFEAGKKAGEFLPRKFNNIFMFGMGASWLAGKALLDVFGNKIKKPLLIFHSSINAIDEKDLAVFITYSGSTKETLAAYKKVKKKTKNIIFISSKEIENEKCILVDKGLLSRTAFPFMFASLLGLFEEYIENFDYVDDIVKTLKNKNNELKQKAKKIAEFIWQYRNKKLTFISDYEALVIRFKNQLNENAKMPLQVAYLPEAYHNEIEAKHDALLLYAEKTKRLEKFIEIKKREGKVFFISHKGKSLLSFLSGVLLFDWASYWLSRMNGVSPVKTEKLDRLKSLK